jgi:hypothetical protein
MTAGVEADNPAIELAFGAEVMTVGRLNLLPASLSGRGAMPAIRDRRGANGHRRITRSKALSPRPVERQNLAMKMQIRRFTRFANGFYKKVEDSRAAVRLHFARYKFVRQRKSLSLWMISARKLKQWPPVRIPYLRWQPINSCFHNPFGPVLPTLLWPTVLAGEEGQPGLDHC